MRHVLIDKQGNFGSIAGLPPAAMRYTEARLSPVAALMLDDLKLDTVDFVPTYDESRTEPTVLPSQVSQPAGQRSDRDCGRHGHLDSAAQSARGLRRVDARDRRADVSIDELMEIVEGPDFPTGGDHLRSQRHSPRVLHRSRHASWFGPAPGSKSARKGRSRIVVTRDSLSAVP